MLRLPKSARTPANDSVKDLIRPPAAGAVQKAGLETRLFLLAVAPRLSTAGRQLHAQRNRQWAKVVKAANITVD